MMKVTKKRDLVDIQNESSNNSNSDGDDDDDDTEICSNAEAEVLPKKNVLQIDLKEFNETEDNEIKNGKKKRKQGIIYLSNIPKHMNVTRMREYLSQYGDIKRIYLQPEKQSLEKQKNKKKRLARHFTEGWVEFHSKRAAKKVAELINNTQIGTRKKSQFYDSLWNIKYLPRFKWVHLTERLNYEQAVYKQRLRAEVSQARKEATFFQNNLEKNEILRKKKKQAEKLNK